MNVMYAVGFGSEGLTNDGGQFCGVVTKFVNWFKPRNCGTFLNICIKIMKNLSNYMENFRKIKTF